MDIERSSEILKAIGHPARLKILFGLSSGRECNVNEMVSHLKIPQSTASQHLGILRSRGIIGARKEGVKVCYSIKEPMVQSIIDILKK